VPLELQQCHHTKPQFAREASCSVCFSKDLNQITSAETLSTALYLASVKERATEEIIGAGGMAFSCMVDGQRTME